MKAITVKYLPATNYNGAKLKAFDMDGNQITISYPYDLPEGEKHQAAARALCEKMGWTGRLVQGATKEGSVFVFDPKSLGSVEVVFAGTRRKRGQR